MDEIFKEDREVRFPVEKHEATSIIHATARAVYDQQYDVLVIDLWADHEGGCEDDGSEPGCRFCSPEFPRDKRELLDLSDIPGRASAKKAYALRLAVQKADWWYEEVERRAAARLAQLPLPGVTSGLPAEGA